MQRRPVADTGLIVSAMGLGTVKLGRNQAVRYPHGFALPDERSAANLLRQARELGLNLLDTAPAYGTSEARLGRLLRGQRSDWVLCTKVGEEFDGRLSRFDFSASHTRRSVERSLRRLGTDHLDIVLIHSDGRDRDILEHGEALDTLLELRRAGWVRAVGMSTKTVAGGVLAARHCDVVMATYSRAHAEERPVLDACAETGTAVFVKKALASGHLCVQDDADPVEHGLRFVYAHPAVTSVVIGTIDPRHLRHNALVATQLTAGTRNGH